MPWIFFQFPTIYSARGPSWLRSYWIYNYPWNQCLSPLMLWLRIYIRARCTTLSDKVCQWLVIGRWFSPGPPVSSTIKTDRHDITAILLKVALNTIKQANKQANKQTNKQNLFSIMTNLFLTGADKQHDKTSSRWLTYLCTIVPFRRCILSSISITKS